MRSIAEWYAVSLDIDDAQRAQQALEATRAQLARAAQLATVAEASASIGSDLRVPLTRLVADALNKVHPHLKLHDLTAPPGARLPPDFGR